MLPILVGLVIGLIILTLRIIMTQTEAAASLAAVQTQLSGVATAVAALQTAGNNVTPELQSAISGVASGASALVALVTPPAP